MKYVIVGMHGSGKKELFNMLNDNNIKCGMIFANKEVEDPRYEVFSDEEIGELFENKAYIFIKELDEFEKNGYEGITLYEYDTNDVFILSPDQFVSIPVQTFNEDVCLIWLDDCKTARRQRYKDEQRKNDFSQRETYERRDIDEFVKTIYNNRAFHILYFTNEDIQRVSSIVEACVKYPDLVNIFEKTFK